MFIADLRRGENYKKAKKGIKSLINALRKVKATDEQIVNQLMEEYGLSREEALEKLK